MWRHSWLTVTIPSMSLRWYSRPKLTSYTCNSKSWNQNKTGHRYVCIIAHMECCSPVCALASKARSCLLLEEMLFSYVLVHPWRHALYPSTSSVLVCIKIALCFARQSRRRSLSTLATVWEKSARVCAAPKPQVFSKVLKTAMKLFLWVLITLMSSRTFWK